MHAIVAIKQVPDTSNVRINPETGTLIREGVPAIINPYDAHAVELAVRLKRKFGGKVTIITMGPPKASEALVECVEQGADRRKLLFARHPGVDPVQLPEVDPFNAQLPATLAGLLGEIPGVAAGRPAIGSAARQSRLRRNEQPRVGVQRFAQQLPGDIGTVGVGGINEVYT